MATNEDAAIALEKALFEIKRVIVGQDHMIERLLVALLARGHVMLEGLPGLAKTLAVSTLAQVIGGSFVRLQFTPDLLPSDLVGTRIWKSSDEEFDIEWGPVFANFVLTDEVNRAPAKVQSALLEVMEERQVSIGGVTRPLPSPFLVLATQNPVESEGVYTLPEAQRDRFLMKVLVSYPSPSEELEIVRRVGVSTPSTSEIVSLAELKKYQSLADEVYVDTAVAQYAVDLVMATREPTRRGLADLGPMLEFGVSTRATLGLVSAGRALALLRGRSHTTSQDVFDVAREVLRHRLMLSYEALAKGLTADDILTRILAHVPAAAISPTESAKTAPATLPAPPTPVSPAVPGPQGASYIPSSALPPPTTAPLASPDSDTKNAAPGIVPSKNDLLSAPAPRPQDRLPGPEDDPSTPAQR